MFGKSHETPPWEPSVTGPFDRWPAHSGFEKFYGLLQGESDPTHRCCRWRDPDLGAARAGLPFQRRYHRPGDREGSQPQSLTPDRPFFIYYAPAASTTRTPARKWIDKYQGKFDQGWDKLREEILARQIERGIMPPNTKLAPMPDIASHGIRSGRRKRGCCRVRWGSTPRQLRAHRPRDRPADRGDRRPRGAGQHPRRLGRRR